MEYQRGRQKGRRERCDCTQVTVYSCLHSPFIPAAHLRLLSVRLRLHSHSVWAAAETKTSLFCQKILDLYFCPPNPFVFHLIPSVETFPFHFDGGAWLTINFSDLKGRRWLQDVQQQQQHGSHFKPHRCCAVHRPQFSHHHGLVNICNKSLKITILTLTEKRHPLVFFIQLTKLWIHKSVVK